MTAHPPPPGRSPAAASGRPRAEAAPCPVCGTAGAAVFAEIPRAPILCNAPCATREAALAVPRGDLRLAFCRGCGHVFNTTFDPELLRYASGYEASLHFSPRFQRHAETLAARLVARYGLRGKDVIEIGCGRGEFLRLVCELGGNRGLGFDPAWRAEDNPAELEERFAILPEAYSARHSDRRADLICCRHLLEHIQYPADLLRTVRQAVEGQPDAAVYVEVPNLLFALRDGSVWDFLYEHCSYFSASSLATAFETCGFAIAALGEGYDGQFLEIEATAPRRARSDAGPPEGAVEYLAGLAERFADLYHRRLDQWRERLGQFAAKGRNVAVWGGGSKAVMFLNALQDHGRIDHVIDLNPRKRGLHLPGTGQRFVQPADLRDRPPELILVMNPIYEDEIRRMAASAGLTGQIACV